MDTNVTNKQVACVKIGRYSVTLDKDKMETLHGFCHSGDTEIGYIREIMDMTNKHVVLAHLYMVALVVAMMVAGWLEGGAL